MDKQIFSQQLDEALRTTGISQHELAERIGMTARSLSRIKRSPDVPLTYEHISRVAAALNYDINFFTGPKIDNDGYVKVPFREANAGMGGGCTNGSRRILSHMSFKVDWLMTKTTHPEKLSLIKAVGDSMSPTIPPDSVVMIDEGQIEPINGKIFYLSINNEYFIKRIETSGGVITALLSDNGPHRRPIDGADIVQIFGRALVQVGEL